MRSLWIRSRPFPSSPCSLSETSSLSETNGIFAVVQDVLLLLLLEAERGLEDMVKKSGLFPRGDAERRARRIGVESRGSCRCRKSCRDKWK